MERVRLGIIGLGLAWERLHAPALDRLKDRFEIIAVCDTDINKANLVAAGINLPPNSAFSDYREMLETCPGIEAVDVLVPIGESFECASAVIKSGKHLITEKPLAHTPEAARELVKLKDKHNIKMMVAENIRYEEENAIIKKLISDGQVGDVVYFVDNHIVEYQQQAQTGGFAQTNWRQHPNFSGGVLLDSGIHHIARTRFFFGDVQSIAAHGRPSNVGFSPYSCVNALFTFKDDIAGHYSFLLTGKETQAPLIGLRIFGTHGEIYLEERNCGFVNITYRDGRNNGVITYAPSQGYFHEFEDFHTAIRLGGRIESTPEKALGDIESIFHMIEAIKLGQVIKPTKNHSFENAGTPLAQMYMPGISKQQLRESVQMERKIY